MAAPVHKPLDLENFQVVDEHEIHLFRVSAAGCVELKRRPDFPIVSMRTNGDWWGNEVGLPFRADDLRLLADFCTQFADRMDKVS